MKTVPMEIVSRTDKGMVRKINEDSIAILPDEGIAVLADGMGGYNAGEVASRIAVETIATEIMYCLQREEGATQDDVERAVQKANAAIFSAVADNKGLAGMATTVVCAVFFEDVLWHVHLGDSRLYRLRGDELKPLTSDHSMLQELVDLGMFFSVDEARAAGIPGHILTHGLGVEKEVMPDFGVSELEADDIFLLCSDGLTNMVPEETLRLIIRSGADNLSEVGDRLVQRALHGGGLDNISLILARKAV